MVLCMDWGWLTVLLLPTDGRKKVPAVKLKGVYDESESEDEDEDIDHMSYEEWKRTHNRREKQKVKSLSEAKGQEKKKDDLSRLLLNEQKERLILRRPRPQMTREEHTKLLRWMFPFASK